MASKQSAVGRVKSTAASRRLAATAQQAVERAAEAKKRVRDAKAELKSLRKLAKVAKKAAKVALRKVKAQAAKPKAAAPARAVPARSAAARTAAAPSVRAATPKSRRKPTPPKAPVRRRQPAEVARSVIGRMQKEESGQPTRATESVAPRDVAAPQPSLSQPDSNSDPAQTGAP
jgi:hypothetical protein